MLSSVIVSVIIQETKSTRPDRDLASTHKVVRLVKWKQNDREKIPKPFRCKLLTWNIGSLKYDFYQTHMAANYHSISNCLFD